MKYLLFESEIRGALEKMSRLQRVTFATACATRLARPYHWFHQRSGQGDLTGFDEALELAWSISAGKRPDNDKLRLLCSSLEEQVPDVEDDDWVLTSAVAQNALAAAIYALLSYSEKGTDNPVWAARQLFEAADSLSQSKLPAATIDPVDAPETDLAARGISDALRESMGGVSTDSIRRHAEEDGERFEQLLPSSIDSW